MIIYLSLFFFTSLFSVSGDEAFFFVPLKKPKEGSSQIIDDGWSTLQIKLQHNDSMVILFYGTNTLTIIVGEAKRC
jgi:hypothetical protein